MTDDADGRALVERLRAERDERRRLAELIHDGPVQLVAAIAQMLDAAHHAISAGDVASGAPIVERALAVAREASVDLREIVSGIEPDALRELGLAAALGELTERHAGPARRGVSTSMSPPATTSARVPSPGLYQIVRDALDQAVRRGPPARGHDLDPQAAGGVELADRGRRRAGAPRSRARCPGGACGRAERRRSASETDAAGTWITIRLPPSAARL